MEQRNRFINTRFTETEFINIGSTAKKIGYSRSEYLRLSVLSEDKILVVSNKPNKSADDKTAILTDEKELRLLLNIANNVNQIAKISNQTKQVPSMEVLINIKNQIENYLDNQVQ